MGRRGGRSGIADVIPLTDSVRPWIGLSILGGLLSIACGLDGSDDQRIAELESRVATLETQVAEAIADPGTASDATPPPTTALDATPPPTSTPIPPTPAGGDFTPPEFVEVSISPSVADVTTGDVNMSVTMRIIDDLSGVGTVQLDFVSPSKVQRRPVFFHTSHFAPVGSLTDGTYAYTLPLPRFSESGTWRLETAYLTDGVGNKRQYSHDEFVALGFPASFEVVYDP